MRPIEHDGARDQHERGQGQTLKVVRATKARQRPPQPGDERGSDEKTLEDAHGCQRAVAAGARHQGAALILGTDWCGSAPVSDGRARIVAARSCDH